MQHERDAVVVGGGLAGLAAALGLLERGLSVVVLEKQAGLGGSSRMSGGWFAFSGTSVQRRSGVRDTDEEFIADMMATGGGFADPQLLARMVSRQHSAFAVIDRANAGTDELKISAGMTVPRAHLVRIRDLIDYLEREVRAAGGEILLDRPATTLCWKGQRVTGVTSGHDEFTGLCAVVLATGGFSRSRELIELFVPHQSAAMPYGGLGSTGDGLLMAWRQGAGLADIGHVSGTFGQHPDTADDEHELLTSNYLGGIIVNNRGQRFADESDSYKALGAAVLAQPGQLAFQVFDAVVRARSRPGIPLSDMERLDELGHLVSAPSISALERAIDVPPGSLGATVEAYNDGVATGVDEFGRTGLVNGSGSRVPVLEPPFYAYPAVTAMTSTYGGIRVAPDTSVLRMDGSQIEGLYAAGEVVGGFHGSSYMTGTALTKALVLGLEVGRTVASGG